MVKGKQSRGLTENLAKVAPRGVSSKIIIRSKSATHPDLESIISDNGAILPNPSCAVGAYGMSVQAPTALEPTALEPKALEPKALSIELFKAKGVMGHRPTALKGRRAESPTYTSLG